MSERSLMVLLLVLKTSDRQVVTHLFAFVLHWSDANRSAFRGKRVSISIPSSCFLTDCLSLHYNLSRCLFNVQALLEPTTVWAHLCERRAFFMSAPFLLTSRPTPFTIRGIAFGKGCYSCQSPATALVAS